MRQITEVLRLAAQGLSYRQIGQSLNVSPSTVQGYVKRAQRVGLSWPLPDDLDGFALEERLFTRGFSAACGGAQDRAGNTALAISISCTVNYTFSGFSAPISNPPSVNTGNAGKAHPVKFQLTTTTGTFMSALSSVRSITIQNTSCSAFANNRPTPSRSRW
jgi:hypothetical protein